MKKVLFPGSFSPPTLGHLDLIRRAAALFDRVYVGIAKNPRKNDEFSLEEKKEMLALITSSLKNVEIVSYEKLSADFSKHHGIDCLLRGLRVFSDFDYEYQMAESNRKMGGIETLFLIADPQYSHIASSLIHEIAGCGHRLHGFVPDVIEEFVFERISKNG